MICGVMLGGEWNRDFNVKILKIIGFISLATYLNCQIQETAEFDGKYGFDDLLTLLPSFIYAFFMLMGLRKFYIDQKVRINILWLDMQEILWDPLFNDRLRSCLAYLRNLYLLGLLILIINFYIASV